MESISLTLGSRRIKQSVRQIPVAVHSPAHNYLSGGFFVEQEMLLEWTEHHEKAPVAQAKMLETAVRTNLRMLLNQSAGGLNDVEITIRYLPSGIYRVPLILVLHIRDKIVGLA
jgi:hypothetical protein